MKFFYMHPCMVDATFFCTSVAVTSLLQLYYNTAVFTTGHFTSCICVVQPICHCCFLKRHMVPNQESLYMYTVKLQLDLVACMKGQTFLTNLSDSQFPIFEYGFGDKLTLMTKFK